MLIVIIISCNKALLLNLNLCFCLKSIYVISVLFLASVRVKMNGQDLLVIFQRSNTALNVSKLSVASRFHSERLFN